MLDGKNVYWYIGFKKYFV